MDKPGGVADVSALLRDEGISIETLLQRGKSATESVPVVMTMHLADADAMRRAADKIARVSLVVEPPVKNEYPLDPSEESSMLFWNT